MEFHILIYILFYYKDFYYYFFDFNLDYDNFSRIQREYRNFIIEQKELPVLKEVVFVKPEASRRESFGRRPFGRGQPERGQFRGEYSGGGSGRREQKRTPSFSGRRWK